MDARITVQSLEAPKNRRATPEGAMVDVAGWLSAPVDWAGEKRLERLWNDRHRSRLGVGLCVANNPRRHFLLLNVQDDLDWVRSELEALAAQVEDVRETDDDGVGEREVAGA